LPYLLLADAEIAHIAIVRQPTTMSCSKHGHDLLDTSAE
jgi:hypothetical protein